LGSPVQDLGRGAADNWTQNQPPGSIAGDSERIPEEADHELILFTLEE
jgi:hypothetical protein